jgi:hypothetical protein
VVDPRQAYSQFDSFGASPVFVVLSRASISALIFLPAWLEPLAQGNRDRVGALIKEVRAALLSRAGY